MKEFTKDEIVALKQLAQERIEHNMIICGNKIGPKPNVFPKGYKGPRSFAEAMNRCGRKRTIEEINADEKNIQDFLESMQHILNKLKKLPR